MIAFITQLNNDNFTDFIKKDGFVLIDIKAEWCGPCRMISPIIDEISNEYQGKLSVGKIDADESSETISELGIRNIPTLILYKDGEIIEKYTGSIDKRGLIEIIDKHLS